MVARIRAMTNEGEEQSKAEGSIDCIFKMIDLTSDDKYQLIINKNELDEVLSENRLKICTLLPSEVIDDISFKGTVKCACGIYKESHVQIYYVDFPEKSFYVIFRVLTDGKDVYNNPKSVRSFTGMIELTL